MEKIFCLIQSHLFIFSFNYLRFNVISKNLAKIGAKELCPCFLLGILVLGLIFRRLTHFDLITVCDVRKKCFLNFVHFLN